MNDAPPFPPTHDRLFPRPARGPAPVGPHVPADAVGRARPAGLTPPGTASFGRSAASPESAVHLVWSDPVTGERLRIAMDASPEMLQRLQGEGFHVDSEITRTAS